MSNSIKGLTFMLVFGKWARPKISFAKNETVIFRLCLGYVSFSINTVDMEVLVNELNKKIR